MRGFRRRFPRHRSTVLDILFAAKFVPAFPIHTKFSLQELSDIRSQAKQRIGWSVLFAKAHAIVAQQTPELRDLFVKRPYRHLYRHPNSVLSISVHRRDDDGMERLIWGKVSKVEELSLAEIQSKFDGFVTAPMQEVYREGLILESAPCLARRLAWCWVMNWGARKRAKHVGTFSISSLAGQGCLNAFHPLVTSSSLAFGPLQKSGEMDVVLLCDHRIIDGVLAANALRNMELVLQNQLCEELKSLSAQ